MHKELTKTHQKYSDSEIINIVVDNFMALARIPRPSHHEEKVSRYLTDWAVDRGFKAFRDSFNNVRIDVPATEGMENLPTTVLQAHMDMVVAVEKGKDFDPISDPITVIRNDDDGILTADGTSLGADDGSGIALAMAVAEGKMDHGPLRIILTADEEDGLEGAFNLSADWLEGTSYLINLDTEDPDEVLVSTASGHAVRVKKQLAFEEPSGNLAVHVRLYNLKGGHSGMEIDKGRLNSIQGMACFLKELEREGIDCQLASFEGGHVGNAIPSSADAVLVIPSEEKEKLTQTLAAYVDSLNVKYAGIEDDIQYTITEMAELPLVVAMEEKNHLIKFVSEIIDGVYTWSPDIEGLVESSSNLGVASVNPDGLSMLTNIRSSSPEKETEILEAQLALAEACGYETESSHMADAWPFDPDSKLLALTKKIYKEQNGKDIRVAALHVGLECGTFKRLKPELDLISIGPDQRDIHSTKETLYLNSIPKVWHLLEGILAEINR